MAMTSRMVVFKLVCLALAGVAVVLGFHELLFSQLPNIFRDPVEDMSFGWFVPLFSAYVVWAERHRIAASFGDASWVGLVSMLPFLALGFLGVRGTQVRLSVLAIAGFVVAVPWTLFGRKTASRVLFPALFLLFCIPLATFLDVITVHLRLLASSVAYAVLCGFGADITLHGTAIAAADGSFAIDVANPCAGLRSIFALAALTAGYAYFNQPTWLRRGILFVMAVPIAIVGNVMRVLTICAVAATASPDFAMGFYHDYSGYVVFLVAILLMIVTGEAINKVSAKVRGK